LVLSAAATGVWHERTARPPMCTVQAPHCPIPQPYFVPRRFSTSRITHRSGMSAGASTVAGRPFTVSLYGMVESLNAKIIARIKLG
jgi:hypothetical protein